MVGFMVTIDGSEGTDCSCDIDEMGCAPGGGGKFEADDVGAAVGIGCCCCCSLFSCSNKSSNSSGCSYNVKNVFSFKLYLVRFIFRRFNLLNLI